MIKKRISFQIDVVGGCNLRCPTCPVGNSENVRNSRGVMSPQTLNSILEKATSECDVSGVALFNWTEPLLHPRIDEMVEVVNRHKLTCRISSNLNIDKPEQYRKLLTSNPAGLRISMSGLNQKSYGRTHKGGEIDVVKRNVDLLLQIKEAYQSSTRIELTFHRYLSNVDELSEVKKYCEDRGIIFQSQYALMLPLEKVLGYCGESGYSEIIGDDQAIINDLLLPLTDALHSAAAMKSEPCKLLEDFVTLNWRGDALLCCAAFDEGKFAIANYLDISFQDLQAARRKQSVCSLCSKHGVSNYFIYNVPDMEQLVAKRLRVANPDNQG